MKIKVIRNGKEIILEGTQDVSLLEQLRNNGIHLSAFCGGKGKCGKCKVQMISGVTEITGADRKYLSEAELSAGFRLACMAYPKGDCSLQVVSEEAGFEVVAEHCGNRQETGLLTEQDYDISIDIGTTTIAMELIGESSRKVLHTVTAVNHQRAFGADVISRIQASNEGQGEKLQETIRRDLSDGINRLMEESGAAGSRVRRIAIAGNTAMGHLLMGYSCKSLGVYPFTPVNIGTIKITASKLLEAWKPEVLNSETEVVLLPGFSTYVGADIAAGMLACDFDQREKPCLFVDLGTNGEMAVGNKNRILVASTAAGPAFEGGNISCGMGSIPGAISSVSMEKGDVRIRTIGDKPPIGLCGTGVIEAVYELQKEGMVDETGMLEEDYFEEGFELAKTREGESIVFTQKDVREIQLAKSAVRAGIETLLKRYGITYEEVEHVFLAGGFGYRMDVEKMVGIGMFPEELKNKTTAIGNSSLAGAALYLALPEAEERLEKLVELSEEVGLSSDKDFNDFYMEYMFFS